jgi:hypothetical protein
MCHGSSFVNGHGHTTKTDDTRCGITAAFGRNANDAALSEDFDVLDPNLSAHDATEATRATAHLAAVLRRAARMPHARLDIGHGFSE